MRRRLMSEMAIVAASVLLAGCSSSTEPQQSSAQGYALHIVVSPTAPAVGDTITATFTIENATSGTLTRTFADDWLEPLTRSVGTAPILQPVGGFGEWIPTRTLTLAPHETVTGAHEYEATGAGDAELSGCLPADVATGSDAICTHAIFTVGLHSHSSTHRAGHGLGA